MASSETTDPNQALLASGSQHWTRKVSEELGWRSMAASPRDVWILCAQRLVRMFAYGSSTLVLTIYLYAGGFSEGRIGLFMTMTLLGDVFLSFVLTLVADRLGRRRILMGGALLMSFSGVCFSLSTNFWILLIASIFGVISPSGNEIGPFRAIEESTMAHLIPQDRRSDVYAWYNLIGSAGSALGALICGLIVQILMSHFGWEAIHAYRAIFVLYSFIGLLKAGLTLLLSSACELEPMEQSQSYQSVNREELRPMNRSPSNVDADDDADNDASGAKGTPPTPTIYTRIVGLIPNISSQSREILYRLCLLFAIDSFASGLVASSWITFFFNEKFKLSADRLGTIFFVANIIASASGLAASSLAKRIGLVKTMVFTHLPSAIFLAMIPIPPSVGPAAALLFLRASTASMDQAPRQAFLSAAVLSTERTAVMGIVNVVKTFSQSGGPLLTGLMAASGYFWVVFLMAGFLKASYDLAMLRMFLGFKGREETGGS